MSFLLNILRPVRSVVPRVQSTIGPMRFVSYRDKCAEAPFPRCSPQNIKKTDCYNRRKVKKVSPFQNFYENPDCCLNPCPDAFPRFDDLYYSISDKAKRKYQQTWHECPRIKKRLPICCYEQYIMPPIKRRKRGKKELGTACVVEKCHLKGECPKLILPGCKKVRNPPKCFTVRKPTDCKKICTPYPSYSECKSKKGRALLPSECYCLNTVSLCTIYQLIREGKLKLYRRPFY